MQAFLRFLGLCTLLAAQTGQADFGQYQSHVLEDQSVEITTDRGSLRLTMVHSLAIYAHFVEPGVKQLPGYALSDDRTETTVVLSETDSTLTFGSDRLIAVVDKQNATLSYFLDNQLLIAEEFGYFAFPTQRGFRFELADGEKLLGGGERVLGMNRRGHSMPLYNKAHYGYTTESDQMYYSLPAVMSSNKYAIVFDNSATGRLDIGRDESDVLLFEAKAGRTAYLVAANKDFPGLVESLTQAIGRQPLPPRWAFGNFASRFGYHTEAETRDVIARFRDNKIPLDAVVLDLYWFGKDIFDHMGNLAWDRDAFPNPEQMIEDFLDDGIQTVLISEPFVLTTSKRWGEAIKAGAIAKNFEGAPRLFDFYFGNTGLIDVFNDDAREWLWQIYRELAQQGVAGFWGDLGEPEVHPDNTLHVLSDSGQTATADEVHNAFGHEWARMVYERHQRDFPDRRPFIMMRSGFAGTQRYGIIPWTGDVARSWGGLQSQVELSLQMGLFGLGYIHSDLGGFAGGESFDRELYLRWLQMGVFQPVFRPHAQEQIAPEPVFHDARTIELARKAVEQRYELLPYLSTLAWENSTRGLPFVRPVFFLPEAGDEWLEHTESYLFGDALLVRPIVQPDEDIVATRMPPGVWFHWRRGTRIERPTYEWRYSLDEIPVFVRAGSFVPYAGVAQSTSRYEPGALRIHYYDDESVTTATGHLYEDDGKSPTSLADGAFSLFELHAERHDAGLTIRLSRSGNGYEGMPNERSLALVIENHQYEPSDVTINGVPVEQAPRQSVVFNDGQRRLHILFRQTEDETTVEITR
ncbi:MAG: TIM-barrel domain-containing protein [Pseudomonadota bacterium]